MELSDIKLNLLERITLKYRITKKTLKKIHEFGKTKLSLLFIPHNNERILKIQISNYLLSFLGLLAVALVSLGIIVFIKYLYTKSDNIDIYTRGNTEKIFFLHHDLMGEILENTVEDLISETEELNKVTWERSLREIRNSEALTSSDEFSDKQLGDQENELASNMKIFLLTVKKFANIHGSLARLKANFQNSMDYLETRESIFESMPRGRPLGPGVGLITSTFGYREDPFFVDVGEFHNGIDFASGSGTPIYATAPGRVVEAFSSEGGLGMHIRIDHENGFYTLYGHCSRLFVAEGDIVRRGDIIGHVGSTGKATGSHLHYEVHVGIDPAINPQEFINID